jgi:hypothetical protein
MATYEEFLKAIAVRESGGKYDAVNKAGYLGAYQMGEPALIEAGYYKRDGTSANDWKGEWTGKDNIKSKEDFLKSNDAQDAAIKELMKAQWKYITAYKLDNFIGQTVGDVKISASGLLAGAHLVGVGALKLFFDSKGATVPKDGNSVPVTNYIKEFDGYETPFSPAPKAAFLWPEVQPLHLLAEVEADSFSDPLGRQQPFIYGKWVMKKGDDEGLV